MKSFLSKGLGKVVRDEINDLRGHRSTANHPNNTAPIYNSYQNPEKSDNDSYSHTANSTAGYSQNRAYPHLPHVRKESQNIVETVSSTATDLVSNLIGPDRAVSLSNTINGVISGASVARDVLHNGAVVQLLSKSSGRLLQVVMNLEGSLTFDGNGMQSGFNTVFNVEEAGVGRLRFHNNCNFLGFDGNNPCILSMPLGPKNNPSIEFRVHEVMGSRDLIVLESCIGKGYFLSVTSDGFLKKTHTKEKSVDAQFSVIVLPQYPYTSYPSAIQPGHVPQQNRNYAPSAPSAPPSYEEATAYQSSPSTHGTLYPQFK